MTLIRRFASHCSDAITLPETSILAVELAREDNKRTETALKKEKEKK